ncbi:protein FAM133-like isoform X4 [Oncorhynchus kisutch]|uniref:protein FAM133-like isoform X4 n=1 Tax=Oncorhynchus kisutch TaxID=8019 RepID=UPI0012DBD50A|nr:protein FAM133-like isoform X4 [Oncorhynchus kisutch]
MGKRDKSVLCEPNSCISCQWTRTQCRTLYPGLPEQTTANMNWKKELAKNREKLLGGVDKYKEKEKKKSEKGKKSNRVKKAVFNVLLKTGGRHTAHSSPSSSSSSDSSSSSSSDSEDENEKSTKRKKRSSKKASDDSTVELEPDGKDKSKKRRKKKQKRKNLF